jgi:hypothetical protein
MTAAASYKSKPLNPVYLCAKRDVELVLRISPSRCSRVRSWKLLESDSSETRVNSCQIGNPPALLLLIPYLFVHTIQTVSSLLVANLPNARGR